MTETCGGCGAELFAGQQFCRRCGAPTRKFSTSEIPTQILPAGQQQPQQGPHATDSPPAPYTTPLTSRDTADPVYPSRFAQYHQPPAGAAAAPPAQFTQETAQLARRRSRWPFWALASAVVFALLVVAIIITAQLASQSGEPTRRIIVRGGGAPGSVAPPAQPVPPMPPIQPVVEVPGFEAPELEDTEPLDEEGAEVSGDKTVITKTFPLKPGATFALAQASGDVTVEGWDGDEARVTITKRGGSTDERAGLEILHEASDKRLAFKTGGGGGVRDVEYEIRLPRGVRQIEIGSQSGDVNLSNLAANVSVSLMRGDVRAAGLTGAVNARTMRGDASVDLQNLTPAAPQVYATTRGNVEIKADGANAVLKAETIAGSIKVEGDLPVVPQRRVPGETAAGTLGKGGQSVVARAISGDIRIKRQ